jgi:hypothetical protein
MHDGLMLLIALLASLAGMGWLALSMDVHWAQARGAAPQPALLVNTLRTLGAAALTLSLALCLAVDSASIAVLVWCMALAASTLIVAFTLTWRASVLGMLVFWTSQGAH